MDNMQFEMFSVVIHQNIALIEINSNQHILGIFSLCVWFLRAVFNLSGQNMYLHIALIVK